jgi:hypothetical protein
VQEFVYSNNPYARYGGLIGLAATSIALGPVNKKTTPFKKKGNTINNKSRAFQDIWILLCHPFYLVSVTKIKK